MKFPLWGKINTKKNNNRNIIEILKQVSLFETLNQKELQKVSKVIYERDYKAEEFLFKEGNPGACFFIIKIGSIDIEKNSEKGEVMKLTTLGKGDFLGELSLLNETPRSASARCKTNVKAEVLFREELFNLIKTEPKIGVKLLKELSIIIGERLIRTNEKLIKYSSMEEDFDE